MMLRLISRNFDHKMPKIMKKLHSICEVTPRRHYSIQALVYNHCALMPQKQSRTTWPPSLSHATLEPRSVLLVGFDRKISFL